MLSEMKRILLVLLLVHDALAVPGLEDNKIPVGQPEEPFPLGLPTDEESFNQLQVIFNPAATGKVPKPAPGGTYHFVSSTFPVDARGFHESVFDGIGDYFPSWPSPYKRDYPLTPTLGQRLGLQPHTKYRKRSNPWAEPFVVRKKRAIEPVNISQELNPVNKEHVDYSEGARCSQCSSEGGKRVLLAKGLAKREVHAEDLEDKGEKSAGEIGETKALMSVPNESHFTLHKRYGQRYVRGMEMGSLGFHGDAFNGDFGDFTTMKKRARGAMGFHGDTFSDGFGDFVTMKRSEKKNRQVSKVNDYMALLGEYNNPTENAEMEVSEYDMKSFDPVKKRKPEMNSMGFHGDTFSRGFGEFEPFKKRRPNSGSMGFHGDTFSQGFGDFDTYKKRRPEMDSMGFHGDTFSRGFGDFEPFKKRKPNSGSMGFHGDTFSQGFGDFDTYKKRHPEMDSMGFHGDTFNRGFGEFEPFKKRRQNSGSMGFHGDTFSQGFGDFDTYKKRRPEMDSMGFHGDTFSRGFGDFEPFKKRRPNAGSMGFHGDTFSQGFGDFDTYKKRRPEMDSMGFHGDTFNRGFGDFDVYKKSFAETLASQEAEENQPGNKKCCSHSSIQRHDNEH